MLFAYKARDTHGNVQEDTLEARSADDATRLLRDEGLQVLSLNESEAELSLFPRRITKPELIYTTSQLAIMVDTGITLSAALGGILQQETNPTLRRVLADLKKAVENGEDFSSALAQFPHHFDRTYVSLVKASEATGSLGPMLERIAGYLRKEMETRGKVKAALAYPSVMLLLAAGVTVFLLVHILPKFTPLFASRGTALPTPTVLMMSASNALIHYWYAWLMGVVAAALGLRYAKRTELGRQVFDYLRIHAPIMGPMFRKVIISRSVRTLGTMLSSGVPMLDAIKLAAEVSGNYYYEGLWKRTLDEVSTGKRVCEVLQQSELFPRTLVQMISCGEETGKLDMILQRVSVYYDQEVETSVKATTSLIEPIMISVMGVVVGTIGLALLLPIFSLSKQP